MGRSIRIYSQDSSIYISVGISEPRGCYTCLPFSHVVQIIEVSLIQTGKFRVVMLCIGYSDLYVISRVCEYLKL